ncbi:hypothetical protein CONCODRAFT_76894 [Conidiobolus coronatus NRRL 28638]|uniref:Uncharacterized protein n=1 Tax=Conidiobolus coronatus (strain ATCC 28846 / CBS 209.66 / NRRL 28638) TaxID=796925 RepID=A0A137PHB9_CONC2|nr:hypothetical protein CONCODRAFT_76894 [Conidiobolus coronatus NRRL 28638]|eukprot:KXN74380.1 hypothetical protein CONCODRAFT_76894 [Conidiobolus coronatus NRRL 28638]
MTLKSNPTPASRLSPYATLDARTIPTVPKLLPPLSSATSTIQKSSIDQVCFRYLESATKFNKERELASYMLCFAKDHKDEEKSSRFNPLSGVSIKFIKGYKDCEDYVNHINDDPFQQSFQQTTQNQHINLSVGDHVDTALIAVASIFKPSMKLTDQYIESFSSGKQTKFLTDFIQYGRDFKGIQLLSSVFDKLQDKWFRK